MRRVAPTFVVVVAFGCGASEPRTTTVARPAAPSAKPAPPIADRDHDGIADAVDKCPDDPEDKDGFEDDDGCPDLDNDKDGIPDKDDQCPNAQEIFNGFDDGDGCPDYVNPPKIVLSNPPIVMQVLFADGSSALRKEWESVVVAAKDVLLAHPEFVLVEVEGHADPKEKNTVALSEKRAKTVLDELVKRGVDKTRLRSKGYGAFCPVVVTTSESNRRTELKVVRDPQGPTTFDVGCPAATKAGIVPDPK